MSEAIMKKLGEMDGKLDEITTWQAVHAEKHEALDEDVKEVRGTVYNNPGLKSRVQTLWDSRKEISKRREFWMRILNVVIAALVIAAIMWAMSLYRGS